MSTESGPAENVAPAVALSPAPMTDAEVEAFGERFLVIWQDIYKSILRKYSSQPEKLVRQQQHYTNAYKFILENVKCKTFFETNFSCIRILAN